MNLALHGFLLQVFMSILNFQHGRLLCSAGEPGYLDFDNLPETNFSCQGKVIGGYYADVEAGCQMFHVCTIGQKDEIMDIKFLCLNGTVFDQETRVCERVDEVDCSKSERFYNLNLELYGNNAVTLSLHESNNDEDDLSAPVEEHQQRTTSTRPSTTSTTSTTTSRPSKPSTTVASGSFQHPTGYPQHYQPQPLFPQVHASQSKSLYDDKNSGYHHQYIFHNGERINNNQATSYQLFSNQGVSSTTVTPPQIHQIRFSSTVDPQIIHNEPSTVTPLFHATSSTIQTLLNSNANSPALINPIYHNHGIASTTEQFTVHSNNPRETSDYRDNTDHEQNIRPLEAIQPANKGKISKLTISPIPIQQELPRIVQTKTSQTSQQQRISGNFLPTPTPIESTVRSFYPTPRPSPKPLLSHSVTHQVTQHIHIPPVTIPQLKPHQITINLSPSDIQRIVQNPSPLLPSQSRVIVTAKASVSDESGRPLNTTQLVTLPLPTIPASYDDYKEGDESFDPFYRDVPKIIKNHQIVKSMIQNIKFSRRKRSPDQTKNPMHHIIYDIDNGQWKDTKVTQQIESDQNNNNVTNKNDADITTNIEDFKSIKESLIKYKDILFGDEVNEELFRSLADEIKYGIKDTKESETSNTKSVQQENAIKILDYLKDLNTEASKHFSLNKEDENEEIRNQKVTSEDLLLNINETDQKIITEEKRNIEDTAILKPESEIKVESTTINYEQNEPQEDTYVIILDSYKDSTVKPISTNADDLIETTVSATTTTNTPIEIIVQEETKSASHDISKANEKVICNEKIAEYVARDKPTEIPRSSMTIDDGKQSVISEESSNRTNPVVFTEKNAGTRRKNSRRRSSKRRFSSRIKQQKMNNIKMTEAVHQRENDTTATTVTAATITSTPSIVLFETEITKQIDSHTFEKPTSQISRKISTNIDTRHRTTYSNNLRDNRDHRDHSISKNEEVEESFDHQSKQHYNNFENADESEEQPSTTSEYSNFTENPQNSEETESVDVKYPSEEEKSFESFSEEYETLDSASVTSTDDEEIETNSEQIYNNTDDKYITSTDDEEIEKNSKQIYNKAASFHETAISPENKSSHHKEKNSKARNNDSEEDGHLTTKSSKETNLEEFDGYNTTQLPVEGTDITNDEEDYKSYSESTEDYRTSVDYTGSEEYTDSQADIADTAEETTSTTDGVLKFTDELPKLDDKEDTETTTDIIESHENSEHDYVDDNYEPENYKELKSINKWNDSKEKKSERNGEENKNETGYPNYIKNIEDHQKNDSIKEETWTESIKHVTEITDLNEEVFTILTTTSYPTTLTVSTTTPTTTSSTTTSTTTTTTTVRPTITIPHVTTSKPFKSISRKNYAYIPPMTSPNPVVIKSRQGLVNPKPAKPPKSYNELVPKPVIRKISLISRKPVTIATTTTSTTIGKLYIENTTELVITTTESSKSEENILENKLEAKNHKTVSSNSFRELDTINKEDQLSSPSVQDFPTNTSTDYNPHGSHKNIETFTPYPLSRLPVTPSIKEITKKTEAKPQKISESIGVATTTLFPEKSENVETHTVKYLKEIGTSSSSKIYHDVTESILNFPKESTFISPSTTIRSKIENTTSAIIKLTSFRPINRRPTKPRKHMSFNCLEKEMYRFYGDVRDCRLFHYCSPGFTSRQVLDFRFVCEEGTAFDEVTQSCRHEVRNRKCRNRAW